MCIVAVVAGCQGQVASTPAPTPPTVPPSAVPAPTADVTMIAQPAVNATVHVICKRIDSAGSGFVHVSGVVVTAAHVIRGCGPADIEVQTSDGRTIVATQAYVDEALDIALVVTPEKLDHGLRLYVGNYSVGDFVTIWGFPGGYTAHRALLTTGYVGAIPEADATGKSPRIWINGAINKGNSGGPVLMPGTGDVLGIVVTKMAAMPSWIPTALQAMANQTSGFIYNATLPDGTTKQVTEGQIVAGVLDYLQSQTQLVVGSAVPAGDIASMMKRANIPVL